MSTQAQIIANRHNAKKSTGPRTTQGKAAASKNALTYGLTAANDIITSESQADFDLYRQKILDELDPLTPIESMLADRVVSLSWRLKRTATIQNQTIDALNEKDNSPLAKFTKSLPFNLSGKSPLDTDHLDSRLTLGRLAIKDFANSRVLDRLLMYERRIEHSLYKTLLELQRLNLIKKINTQPEPETT